MNESRQTCEKCSVNTAWERELVSFMPVDAVTRLLLPCSISASMALKLVTSCTDRPAGR